MVRASVLLVFMLLLAAPWRLYAEEAPTSDPAARITALLATLTPARDSMATVEEALAAEGPAILPALRQALAHQRDALGQARTDTDRQMIRDSMDVLDGAIIRLNWGWPPTKRIAEWTARVKTADGDRYQLPVLPQRVSDDTVERVFPAQLFYSMRLPATAPLPLRSCNLFVVQRDGLLKQLTTPKDLEGIFFGTLAAVLPDDEAPVRDAVVAWLRLTQEFAIEQNLRFTIPADSLQVTYRQSVVSSVNGWRGAGRAVVDPTCGFTGVITVNLTFDAFGKLTGISEIRDINPVPPVAQPAPTAPIPATP